MDAHPQDHGARKPGVVSLRPEQPEDEDFLFAVYASTRAEELAVTGWDEATRSAFLNLQFRAMRQGYHASFPQAEFPLSYSTASRWDAWWWIEPVTLFGLWTWFDDNAPPRLVPIPPRARDRRSPETWYEAAQGTFRTITDPAVFHS